MTNSNAKGKRGEREAVKFLKELGHADAQRTQQYNGLGLSDVICPDTLARVHIEVKFGYPANRFSVTSELLRQAFWQASNDCTQGLRPCVLWRNKGATVWQITYHGFTPCVLSTASGALDVGKVLDWLNK